MELLETAIIIVHVLVSLALVGLILLQQGKGAEAGASFGGGASQTVFGSQGSGGFLATSTSWLAVVFFLTSISLAYVAKEKAEVAARGGEISVPVEQSAAPSAFEAPDFGDDSEPVEYNQSLDEFKASLEGGVKSAEDAGFASEVGSEEQAAEAAAEEAANSAVPELE